tara:strand:+ start:364 stop:585 length:222 start_codon:yes stop_codon:yes gene_type:complete
MKYDLIEETEEQIKKRKIEKLALYSMDLHDRIDIGKDYNVYKVIRVPGGWLYTHNRLDRNTMTTTFVPLNTDL